MGKDYKLEQEYKEWFDKYKEAEKVILINRTKLYEQFKINVEPNLTVSIEPSSGRVDCIIRAKMPAGENTKAILFPLQTIDALIDALNEMRKLREFSLTSLPEKPKSPQSAQEAGR